MNIPILESIALSLILGFLIGLQREMSNRSKNVEDFGGARTFALISLAGMLLAWLSNTYEAMLAVGLGALSLLLGAGYITNAAKSGDSGLTTEISALTTFVIGAVVFTYGAGYGVFGAVLILFILNVKERLARFEQTIEKQDLNAAILLAVMSGVIFPFIPQEPIDPWGLFNLYSIWMMVILVAGISFLGYIAFRLFGDRKGTILTGLIGGAASSTAVALAMARKSSEHPALSSYFAVSVMVASTVMLVRAFAEVAILNFSLALSMIGALCTTLVSAIAVIVFFLYKKEAITLDDMPTMKVKNPFELSEALILGVVFGIIIALIRFSNEYAPQTGIYLVSFISGLADIDAIVLTLAGAKNFSTATVQNGIILAIIANSWVKFGIVAFVGSSQARNISFIYFSVVTVSLLLTMLIGN